MPALKDAAIKSIEFEFTFCATVELASRAWVDAPLRREKGRDGITVLIGATSGEIVDTLTTNSSIADIKGALNRARKCFVYG